MKNVFVAVLFAVVAIFLSALGLSAQSALPDSIEPANRSHQVQFTIPPFEPPHGAVITVTATVDDLEDNGNCTLREAIQAANTDTAVDGCPAGNGEDLIVLAAGVYGLSIEGRSEDDNLTGDLDVRSSLVISGAGMDVTVVDANQIDRVLHVHEGSLAELRGLTLRNGRSANGVNGHYTIACAGESGGGIHNSGVLTLTALTMVYNRTGNGYGECYPYGGAGGGGGAIFNQGSLSIFHSLLASNTTGEGGSQFGRGGDGAGIRNTGNLFVADSRIEGNQTGLGGTGGRGSPGPNGFGAGIANWGDMTITSSHIDRNTTGVQGGFPGEGGGLYNAKDMVIRTSTIVDNLGGGGIVNAGRLTIESSAIYGNISRQAGGGILNQAAMSMINSTVSGNRSGDGTIRSGILYYLTMGEPGGGIFNSGWLYLESSTIAANITGEGACNEFYGNTGIITICVPGGAGGGLATEGGSVTVYNTIIAQNSTGKGGADANLSGGVADRGHNLISGSAWLAPLADNGGSTPTHALLSHSSALDAGKCSTLVGNPLVEDQRGEPRPQGVTCDIGAYESALATVPLTYTLYLPLATRERYFGEVAMDCRPSGSVTRLSGSITVDGILQMRNWPLDLVYSDAPDGPILGRLTDDTYKYDPWTDEYRLRNGGPLAGDWYVWVVVQDDRRISEIAHVHTDGETGEGKCQNARIIFQAN